MIIPEGTPVLHLGKYHGIVRGCSGNYAVEFPEGAGGLFLHNCANFVPSNRGRWCRLDELRILKHESPFVQSVSDYITKELRNG